MKKTKTLLLALILTATTTLAWAQKVTYTIGAETQTKLISELNTKGSLNKATYIKLTEAWSNENLIMLCTALNGTINSKTSLIEADLSEITFSESNIIEVRDLFNYCVKLTTVKMPTKEEAEKVTSLYSTFGNCSSLTSIDLFMFTNVTDIRYAFYECSALVECKLPLTLSVTDMTAIFIRCTSLTKIDLSAYVNATDFSYAFYGCSALVECKLPLSVTNLSHTFASCTALTEIDLSDYPEARMFDDTFIDCPALVKCKLPASAMSLSRTFIRCTALTEIDLTDCTKLDNLYLTFAKCSALTWVKLGSLPPSNNSNGFGGTFDGTNPNCLIYLPEGATFHPTVSNFIINGKAYGNITLIDKKPYYCPEAFTLGEKTITYTRDFTNHFANGKQGWNTICLPFDTKLNVNGETQEPFWYSSDLLGKYWLKVLLGSEKMGRVNFEYVGSIQANTPYIIALPGSNMSPMVSMEGKTITFTATNITIPATPAKLEGKAEVDHYACLGTYTEITKQPMYLLTRGTGDKGDSFTLYEEGNIAPFRAYITPLTEEAKQARSLAIGSSDDTTGFDFPQAMGNDSQDGISIAGSKGCIHILAPKAQQIQVVGMDGRTVRTIQVTEGDNTVEGLQQGIYIVKGQKVGVM